MGRQAAAYSVRHVAVWLPAQEHFGENIGETPTRTILIELKGEAAGQRSDAVLGPVTAP